MSATRLAAAARLLDRHVGLLLEEAQKLARRDSRMPPRILADDEHPQLERVGEACGEALEAPEVRPAAGPQPGR